MLSNIVHITEEFFWKVNMVRFSFRSILSYFSGMNGMKWNVQMWKKKRHFASGLGNQDYRRNAKHRLNAINEYKSLGAKTLHFSQPPPCSSIKSTALAWGWNGNKQPPGQAPRDKSQQQQTWHICTHQQLPHAGERRSCLSPCQLILGFGAELVPPWEAKGHKRLSRPVTGFSRKSPHSNLSTLASSAHIPPSHPWLLTRSPQDNTLYITDREESKN